MPWFWRSKRETGPSVIAYDDKLGARLEELIALGRKLLDDPDAIDKTALPYDESDRELSQKEGRPPRRKQFIDCPAGMPIKQELFGAWNGASYALLATIAGQAHPFVKLWEDKCYGSVIGCLQEGLGILGAFRDSWRMGTLWSIKVIKA